MKYALHAALAVTLAALPAAAQEIVLDFEPDISVSQGFSQNIAIIGTPGTPGSQDLVINNFFNSDNTTRQSIFMPFIGSTVITTGNFVDGSAEAALLGDGDVVDSTTVFGGPNSFSAVFADQGLAAGEWYDATDEITGFTGFSFVDGPDTYYGYAEITVSPDAGGQISINSVTYQGRAGIGITIPEPTTLSLAALGGVAMLRRRRA